MTDKTSEPAGYEPAMPGTSPTRRGGRPKIPPGRQGSSWVPPTAPTAAAAADHAPAPSAALIPAHYPTQQPVPASAAKPVARKPKAAPGKLQRTLGPLSLEDTIAAATALVVLRGPYVIVHVETDGSATSCGAILSIHALRVDKRKPAAEYNTRVLPLRALADKRPGVSLQEAIAGLCEFLGDHRQFVFAHRALATQPFLGQAARQYGLSIENPVGDLVDLARLAWPDRADYSLAGLAEDLLPELGPIQAAGDAPKAILGLLQASSKVLTAPGGRVSSSIVHWGRSKDTFEFKPSPW